MKPPLRTKSVGTKVSEAEFALLEERARGAGMRLAEWVREALLAAPVEPGMGSGVDSGAVALAEVLALRSLLLNLHFRAAKGEPVAEADPLNMALTLITTPTLMYLRPRIALRRQIAQPRSPSQLRTRTRVFVI
jgi:hypothetical protein